MAEPDIKLKKSIIVIMSWVAILCFVIVICTTLVGFFMQENYNDKYEDWYNSDTDTSSTYRARMKEAEDAVTLWGRITLLFIYFTILTLIFILTMALGVWKYTQ